MSTQISGPLAELIRSQQEEIAKYKWIESEKLGRDIGLQQATDDWFNHHFGNWIQAQRQQIDAALNLARV